MKHLCEGYTTGGPIAVLRRNGASSWDGNFDYFRVIKAHRHSSVYVDSDFNGFGPLLVFFQESDGNFHVFQDRSCFAVVSEISGDEGYEVREQFDELLPSLPLSPILRSANFGGEIAIFDASISGNMIRFDGVGAGRSALDSELVLDKPDMALIEVEVGIWEASEIFYRSRNLEFSGLYFQRSG